MNRKTIRTRSSWSTNNLSKKLSLYEDDISQISRNTIIPFVNSRFSMVSPHYILNTGGKKQINSSNGLKLSLLIIFNKVQKLAKMTVGRHCMGSLKIITFKQKLLQVFHTKKQQFKQSAFQQMKKYKIIKDAQVKLQSLNFINRKVINQQLSYAFRKIIINNYLICLKKGEKQSQNMLIVENEQKMQDSQKTIKQKNYNNEIKMNRISTQSLRSSPSQLKPDKMVKSSKNYAIWGVNCQFNNI